MLDLIELFDFAQHLMKKEEKVTPQGWRSIRANEQGVITIPDGYGLLIRLDSSTGEAIMESVIDQHEPDIHPNCYIPASFSGVKVLHGGGSGAAVFAGRHPVLHEVVMKHAGAKDTREVLSLAEIGKELKRRDPKAAAYLRKRIPEFSFFYLSPHHVRDRSAELCNTLRQDAFTKLLVKHQDSPTQDAGDSDSEGEENSLMFQRPGSTRVGQDKRNLLVHRGEPLGIETFFSKVLLHIPSFEDNGKIKDGYDFLSRFVDHLEASQIDNYWKITVGQKAIGGRTSENGAHVLTAGRLQGALLKRTIEEYTAVLRNLRRLTLVREKDVLANTRAEVERLSQSKDCTQISKSCDQFVGSCVSKNFHPVKGRFVMLRQIGQCIRDGTLVLTDSEAKAADFLGRLLKRGTCLSTIFAHSPEFTCALDKVEHSWLNVLQVATGFEDPALTNRIWTCGLTDAGLHNAFVDLKRGLELFDLGKPQLVPEPAFLTKFLMSFFHAFGMEDNGNGSWVRRFDVVHRNGSPPLLKLTRETERKISIAYESYQFALDHFVKELFHQDPQAAALMARYTVLQLVSDAGFCLQRWQSKGGGNARFGYNAKQDLSKWLWRSIWDLYIASEVCDRFSVNALFNNA